VAQVNARSEPDAALAVEQERTARLAAIVAKLKEATEAADPSSLKTNLRMLQDIMVCVLSPPQPQQPQQKRPKNACACKG
jgi:hypothetical protein